MSAEAIEYEGEPLKRSRTVGIVLSFLSPVLGYMYVGQLLKGITVTLLFLLLLEAFVIFFSVLKFFPFLPGLVVVATWLVFSLLVARDVASNIDESDEYVGKQYNHWMFYGLVFLVAYALPIYATGRFLARYLVGFVQVDHALMYPTIQPGDTVMIDRSAYRNGTPGRGDLVVLDARGEGVRILRVVGVEGDIVRIEGETVYVNEEPLERSQLEKDEVTTRTVSIEKDDLLALVEHNHGERYVISVSPRARVLVNTADEVSNGELYVLADNRSHMPRNEQKFDSRSFGPVSSERILGRPIYIAWSDASGDNWYERIGLRTQ